MVMALGTSHCETEKNRSDCRCHFAEQFVASLVTTGLGKRCQTEERQCNGTLRVHAREFPGAHDLIELITGNLLPYKKIVRFIAVQRVNNIIAVSPHMRHVGITLVTGRISVAREIKPISTPTFAIAMIVKQSIDKMLVGEWAKIIDICVDNIRFRWNAD